MIKRSNSQNVQKEEDEKSRMEYLLKMFEEETLVRSSSSLLHERALKLSMSGVFEAGLAS